MSEFASTRMNPEGHTSAPLGARHSSADVANYVRRASAEDTSNDILPASENIVLRLHARVKEYITPEKKLPVETFL